MGGLSDVRQGAAVTFTVQPPSLWSSPTATVLSPSGATVEAPTPSVDTAATTVASDSGNTRSRIRLTDATGFARGRLYRITDATWGEAYAQASAVDGDWLELVEPLPAIPDSGSAVRGIDITVPVSAINTRGRGYRLVVTQGNDERIATFAVVRHPFRNPVDARRVRRHLSQFWPSDPLLSDEQELQNIADEAGRALRGRLAEESRYPDLFFDGDAFEEAGHVAMELALARRNRHAGEDKDNAVRSREFELRDRVAGVVRAGTIYDGDDDGVVDDGEAGFAWGSLTR